MVFVEVVVAAGRLDDDGIVVVGEVSRISHPTMAMAPTVEELTVSVVVDVDQMVPPSVYAQVPANPDETSERQFPVTSPASPPFR